MVTYDSRKRCQFIYCQSGWRDVSDFGCVDRSLARFVRNLGTLGSETCQSLDSDYAAVCDICSHAHKLDLRFNNHVTIAFWRGKLLREGNAMEGTIRRHLAGFVLLGVLVIGTTGCMGLAAQMLYVIKGHKTPAKFKDLEGKKVAVICVSDAGSYGSDSVTYRIGQLISAQLSQNVKKIEVIPQARIEKFQNSRSWEKLDYTEVGRGVDADVVIAVELSSYSLDQGTTMYRGQAQVTTTVYDMKKNGSLVFTDGPDDFIFPRSGRPKMQQSQRDFENKYLAKLSMFIGQKFFKHDMVDHVESNVDF